MPSESHPVPACWTWESCLLYLVRRRHAGMPDVGVIPSASRLAPACRHAGHGRRALCISFSAGMPAYRTWESCPVYLVQRRYAGMPDVGVMPFVSRPVPACRLAGRGSHALCISSGTGMPACRTWESCPLYLVRRRHAGMPDMGVMPSVFRPAPACRHVGHGSNALCISSGAGMPACQTWESCPLYLVRCRQAGMPDVVCPLYLVRCRYAGMPDVGINEQTHMLAW